MSKIDADSGQGIRNGKQYLEGLRDDRDVWIHGEKVDDVTSHPAMSRGAQTLAGFMDKQFDDYLRG
jgi:aromatic ring hydroxylase